MCVCVLCHNKIWLLRSHLIKVLCNRSMLDELGDVPGHLVEMEDEIRSVKSKLASVRRLGTGAKSSQTAVKMEANRDGDEASSNSCLLQQTAQSYLPQPAPTQQNQPVKIPQPAPAQQNQPVKIPQPAPTQQNQPVKIPQPAPTQQNQPVKIPQSAPTQQNQPVKIPQSAPTQQNQPVKIPQSAPTQQNQSVRSTPTQPIQTTSTLNQYHFSSSCVAVRMRETTTLQDGRTHKRLPGLGRGTPYIKPSLVSDTT